MTTDQFKIEAMDCPTEEAMIRKKLTSVSGISALEFNLIDRVLTVKHTHDSTQGIEKAISTLGFEAVPMRSANPNLPAQTPALTPSKAFALGISFLLALASEAWELFSWPFETASIVLSLTAIALCGISVFRKGWISIVNGSLNINALMSVAVTGAVLIGQWPEAAMVMTLFALAETIEALSLDRARRAVQSLVALAPEFSTVLQQDGTWAKVASASINVGATIRVAAGERISHDGVVLEGHSSVDQSPITGESAPVEKTSNDTVFAGTVNQNGFLTVRVAQSFETSTLARIIRQVQQAQSNRAPLQTTVDRFASIYTPIVVSLAILVAVVPPLLFSAAWLESIYKALVVLVIACPCALVISTPVTVVSALAYAARIGILVKGGAYLEAARSLDLVAFDKTGTLTFGRPTVVQAVTLRPSLVSIERLAASLAGCSRHPASVAVTQWAQERSENPLPVSSVLEVPGRGIQARHGSQTWHLGNRSWMEELGTWDRSLEKSTDGWSQNGQTVVFLSDESNLYAVFVLSDAVKPNSANAVKSLKDLGIRTVVLSGDRDLAVEHVAGVVGADEFRAQLLPHDKVETIENLRHDGRTVAMVGDGINDAPALASAHIGIAMGRLGTGSAIETADVVLMDDDLAQIPKLVRLSQKTYSILRQNIVVAIGLKVAVFALTLAGMGSLWMAVFADMGSSLIVVFNGLRSGRAKASR